MNFQRHPNKAIASVHNQLYRRLGFALALLGVACAPGRRMFVVKPPTAERGANTYALSITESRAGLIPEHAYDRPPVLGFGAMSHAGLAADYTWRIARGGLLLCRGNSMQPSNCVRIDTGTIELVDTMIATPSRARKLVREESESVRYSKNGVWLVGTVNGKARRGMAYCSEFEGGARCDAAPLPEGVYVDEVLSGHELFRAQHQHVVWILTRTVPGSFAPSRVPAILRCSSQQVGLALCALAQMDSAQAEQPLSPASGIGPERNSKSTPAPLTNIHAVEREDPQPHGRPITNRTQ